MTPRNAERACTIPAANRTAEDPSATTMRDVERRLGVLEAERTIRTLMAAYLTARDRRSAGREIAALFVPEGIWEGTGPFAARLGSHQGCAAIAERFAGDMPTTLHLIGGEQIRVEGDRATGRWSYLAPAVLDGEAAWMAGVYDNDFVRQDGRRLFAHMRVGPVLAAAHRHGWAKLINPDEHRPPGRG
jgi:SnoaL-like domain